MPRLGQRDLSGLEAFVEDMSVLRSRGYETKQEWANGMNLTRANFDQKLCRARRAGLLKPGRNPSNLFDPFGDKPKMWTW